MGRGRTGGGRRGRIVAARVAQILQPVNLRMASDNMFIATLLDKLAPDALKPATWTAGAKSDYIESILARIPSPAIYVEADGNGKYKAIDGNERLAALAQFKNNEFPLQNLEYFPEHNGKYYRDLALGVRRRIEESRIQIHILDRGTGKAEADNFKRRLGKNP